MKKEKKKRGPIAKLFRFIGTVVAVIVVIAALFFGFLTVTEYKPADRETVSVVNDASEKLQKGTSFWIATWNVGYGALGDNADFFMDGGKMVKTATKERVGENLEVIYSALSDPQDADLPMPSVLFLQETDVSSGRSYKINELEFFRDKLTGYCSTFARNYKCAFVPFPLPPLGKVDSGIATFSVYGISSAERIQLPVPFSWPIRTANLKRCLLVSRVPVEGGGELVLVNLHLEAYDDGEGKIEQTKMLASFLAEERAKGNYVIAGGDFNQIFSSADYNAYPVKEGMWAPGRIDVAAFGDGWQFIMDESNPTCRSLDKPYAGADKSTFQFYLIDGFIVSDNVTVEQYFTRDLGFTATDHNPVYMYLKLD